MQQSIIYYFKFNKFKFNNIQIMNFLQTSNMNKVSACGESDSGYCWRRWQEAMAKSETRVTFAGDNVETLLKPPPMEVRIYNLNDPPSSLSSPSSVSSEEDEPVLRKSVTPWVPPHKRVQAPGPVKLTRKASAPYLGPREKYGRGHRLRDGDSSDEGEYDPSLQCDEEFRDSDDCSDQYGESNKLMCVMSEELTYPTDMDLLRRKHANQHTRDAVIRIKIGIPLNQQTIKFHQDATIMSQVIPEGCVLYEGRIRKERFFDRYGNEV